MSIILLSKNWSLPFESLRSNIINNREKTQQTCEKTGTMTIIWEEQGK